MCLSGSFAGKKSFENRHTKLKLLWFEVESRDCEQGGQGTVELKQYHYRAE